MKSPLNSIARDDNKSIKLRLQYSAYSLPVMYLKFK